MITKDNFADLSSIAIFQIIFQYLLSQGSLFQTQLIASCSLYLVLVGDLIEMDIRVAGLAQRLHWEDRKPSTPLSFPL